MSVGKLAAVDAATQARIESACGFVNQKIGAMRSRVLLVAVLSAAAALLVLIFVRIDVRFPIGAAVLVTFLTAAHARREVSKWYKLLVIRRVVEALGNGLTYSEASSFTRDQFKAMNLFRDRIDVWKSEDQIAGRRNEVDYTLHEVRAAKREKRGKNTVEVVIFKGLVVVLEFNKNFQGQTVVVPDREGKLLGGLFGELDGRGGMQRVTLPDADFEAKYTAYSTDDQQANYLLTPRLLQLIMKARNTLDAELRLAFFQNNLFVAVPSSADRFEVGWFATRVTPAEAVGDLADVVNLAEQLIEVLDLETRIWTRV
ncbi:MAG TPA: DUF3137 domain-containing protein [Longimicrobiales bacterium]